MNNKLPPITELKHEEWLEEVDLKKHGLDMVVSLKCHSSFSEVMLHVQDVGDAKALADYFTRECGTYIDQKTIYMANALARAWQAPTLENGELPNRDYFVHFSTKYGGAFSALVDAADRMTPSYLDVAKEAVRDFPGAAKQE